MSMPDGTVSTRCLSRRRRYSYRDFTPYRTELEAAVIELDEHYAKLKSAARRRLGDLFNANDYPPSLRGLFDLTWDFPNVEPVWQKNSAEL
jgi:hypothetical protein